MHTDWWLLSTSCSRVKEMGNLSRQKKSLRTGCAWITYFVTVPGTSNSKEKTVSGIFWNAAHTAGWPHNTTERREGDPRRRLSQRCSKAARGAQCVGPSLLCVPAPKSPRCWDWRSLGSAVTHTLHTRPPPLSGEHSQQEPSLIIYGTDQEREGTLRRAGLRDGLETPRQKVKWERTWGLLKTF